MGVTSHYRTANAYGAYPGTNPTLLTTDMTHTSLTEPYKEDKSCRRTKSSVLSIISAKSTVKLTLWITILTVSILIPPTHCYLSGYYLDNGIQTRHSSQHLGDWQLQQEEQQQISKELLSMLGLKHKPKVAPGAKDHRSAPKFMMQLYKELEYEEERAEHGITDRAVGGANMHYNLTAPGVTRQAGDADLIMSFQNIASEVLDLPNLLFDFSDVPATERVSRAELRFFKYPVGALSHAEEYHVNIYRQDSAVSNSSKVLETSLPISGHFSGWFDIDVTETVSTWLNVPYSNTGLYVTVTNSKGETVPQKSIGLVSTDAPEELQTFMVAFFQAPAAVHVRQRRAVSKPQRKRNRQKSQSKKPSFMPQGNDYFTFDKCHKAALYIRFMDLNWQEWIIAPDGYAAFHCTGQCTFPLNSYMNATNHAIVQTLVSLMDPSKVPAPCCTPEKMSAISVLYFDDKSNVILKKYHNMVVKTCGCH